MFRRILVVVIVLSLVLVSCVQLNVSSQGPSLSSRLSYVDTVVGIAYTVHVEDLLQGRPAKVEVYFIGGDFNGVIFLVSDEWVQVECGDNCYQYSIPAVSDGGELVIAFLQDRNDTARIVSAALTVYTDQFGLESVGSNPISQNLPHR